MSSQGSSSEEEVVTFTGSGAPDFQDNVTKFEEFFYGLRGVDGHNKL